METRIIQVIKQMLELQKKGYFNVFWEYAGDMQTFHVRIYKGKPLINKRPVLDKTVDLRHGQGNMDWIAEKVCEFEYYKPKPKPIPIEKHLPFFRPFEERKRITFTYRRKKYTAMGLFLANDFVENVQRLNSQDNRENTPKGYVYEDFYRIAKAHGAEMTDIFRYKNRLVVPCEGRIDSFSVRRLLEPENE
jgi:hypothetical protein